MQINYKKRGSLFTSICYAMCAIIILTSSCKKFIDIGEPLTSITTAKVFTNNEDVNAVLAGLYSQMMSGSGGSFNFSNGAASVYAGLSSDELVTYFGAANSEEYQFERNKLLFNNIGPNTIWSPAYSNIYTANAALEGIDASNATTFTDSARRQATGEFKFVRAFSYFYLTNFFGDVPLVLSSDFNITTKLPRSSQADVYKQIILDLQDAQALLPADYAFVPGNERIRPNKQAAAALLARAYLYIKDWRNAEVQASNVINDSRYQLVGLNDVFLKNSNEAIWQLKPNKTVPPFGINDAGKFNALLRWEDLPIDERPFYLDKDFFGSIVDYITPPYYFTPQLASSFEGGDQRKEVWADFRETPSVQPYDGVTIYYATKYKEVNSSPGQTEYYMVLRLAEQYLIRAEARAELDENTGAASDLNAIRTRAGLPSTTAAGKSALLDAVAQERRVELFTEFGHRWFDLKRTGKATAVLSAIATKTPFDPTQLLYPIPASELKNGPLLIQNPGY
jgi:hypothetical protein